MAALIEVALPARTHLNSGAGMLAIIDRAHGVAAMWWLHSWQVAAAPRTPPEIYHARSVSDRTPALFGSKPPAEVERVAQPIPKLVSAHPQFADAIHDFATAFTRELLPLSKAPSAQATTAALQRRPVGSPLPPGGVAMQPQH